MPALELKKFAGVVSQGSRGFGRGLKILSRISGPFLGEAPVLMLNHRTSAPGVMVTIPGPHALFTRENECCVEGN